MSTAVATDQLHFRWKYEKQGNIPIIAIIVLIVIVSIFVLCFIIYRICFKNNKENENQPQNQDEVGNIKLSGV